MKKIAGLSRNKALLAALMFLTMPRAPVFAKDTAMPQFGMPTAQTNGMGGVHAAYTDNVFALLVNPAAMMRVEQRSFFALSPGLLSPQSTFGLITPITDAVSGNLGALGDAADLLGKREGKIVLGFDIREFPLSVAWVADGFGFGLWDRIFVNPNIIGTNVELTVYSDVILPVGFAFRILDTGVHDVDAGITVKPFFRVFAHEQVTILKMMDAGFDFVDSLSVPAIAGAGIDLGFLYRWDIGFSAGLTFDDIFSRGVAVADFMDAGTGTNYYVPFTMNLGLAYDFKIGNFWQEAPRFLADMGFTFAFDWRNITNAFQQDDYQKRNASLDIGLGLQISLADIVKVRLGMNEMLPAAGLGIDLGAFEIDAAYYGREFGLEPGQLSAAALDLTVAIRPGAKKRDWPWTRGSLAGLFTGSSGGN
jgi:opacity protein-like surface antigen